ncbi:hypothetical protein [Streptomyces sp. NPDC059786]|uniref:hypothetical protein n=1 Tax=Streptomyces sp. NPDC059786 TaxID=3346946 RepID=UPI0036462AC1
MRDEMERACWVKFGGVEAGPVVWVNQASPVSPAGTAGRARDSGGAAADRPGPGPGSAAAAAAGAGAAAGCEGTAGVTGS